MTEAIAIAALVVFALITLTWRSFAAPEYVEDEHDFPFGIGGGADHVFHGRSNDR